MRPIELELSGLHSYTDPVLVDFEHLGEHGLFGIFGSIGSGKSTLLDGITLALYGIVDRTSSGRSRAGIVNHHSDRIEVRLRFSISPGGEPEVYEVHRIYRRTDKGTVERVNGRLARIEGTTFEVLADKERELNEAVATLLGLEAPDFMRAVVLPQGRFMRFLHLKGADRRAMLQRIFRLTAYGEGLRKQIRLRREALSLDLEGRRGQLEGIGDASPKAVKEARRTERAARAELKTHSADLEAIQATWEEARRVREQQGRLARAQTELANHLQRQGDVDALIEALTLAERANALKVPYERMNRATGRVDLRQEQAMAARADASRAVEAAARSDQSFAKARADRLAAEPGLQKRRARLERAIVVEADAHERREELAALRQQGSVAAEEHAGRQAELEALEQQLQEALDHRSELGERLAACQVARDDREHITAVVRAHDQIRALDEQLATLDGQMAEIRAEIAGADQRVDEARQCLVQAEAARDAALLSLEQLPAEDPPFDAEHAAGPLRAWAAAWSERFRADALLTERTALAKTRVAHRCETTETLGQARSHGAQIGTQLQGARAALREQAERNSAALLAESLADGEPCPVCGSEEHPSPASPVTLDDLAVQVLAEAETRANQWLQAAAHRAARADADAERAIAGQTEAEHRLAAAVEAQDAARVEAECALPMPLEGEPAAVQERFRLWLGERQDRARSRQATIETLQSELTEARVAVERARQPLAAAEAQRTGAATRMARLQTERDVLSAETGTAWDHFQSVQGSITLFDVARLKAEMARKDEEAAVLVPAIRDLEVRTATLQGDQHAARAMAAAAAVHHSQLEERIRQTENELERLSGRLGELAPEGAPSAVLDATTARLQTLEQAELAAGETRDHLREAQAAAQRAAAEAEAEARSALAELGAANAELDRTLDRVGLTADDDLDRIVEQALPPEERARVHTEVEGWTQTRSALEARVQSAESELGDAAVDARAWEILDARRVSASARCDTARAAHHSAAHHLTDLESRAERYTALRGELHGLERKAARLEQLSTLLRGDHFVDFLANDHLRELVHEANRHLTRLTDNRYSLVLGSDGMFQIRDADGGGATRPVHTLSGGETFVASLALALALSTQVQARSQHPLEFFFLDEGFGSLDAEALDRVMGALEALRQDRRTIGLISHLPTVRERVPRYLDVSEPGRDGSIGTTVTVRDN